MILIHFLAVSQIYLLKINIKEADFPQPDKTIVKNKGQQNETKEISFVYNTFMT